MPTLEFNKMEGAGNDFVVFDNRISQFSLEEIINITPKLCNRRFGIGADGILILEAAQNPDADYTMIYRNADGSDAGMCGNGGRCMALFASKNGFGTSHSFNVHDNVYKATVSETDVSITFPIQVIPEHIELSGKKLIKADAATEHVILFVDRDKLEVEKNLKQSGRAIRMHEKMNPPGTNVNFVCYENNHSLEVQTYERGVEDLTLACGTGALASAISTHYSRQLKEEHSVFNVNMKGGALKVSFDFDTTSNTYNNLILAGPAHFVFEGSITI